MSNLEIVREGYAQVLTMPPNVKYQAVLLACVRSVSCCGRLSGHCYALIAHELYSGHL